MVLVVVVAVVDGGSGGGGAAVLVVIVAIVALAVEVVAVADGVPFAVDAVASVAGIAHGALVLAVSAAVVLVVYLPSLCYCFGYLCSPNLSFVYGGRIIWRLECIRRSKETSTR